MNRSISMALLAMLLLSMLALAAHGMRIPPNQVQRIIDSGELRVVVNHAPTSTYPTSDGLAGLEYELVRSFAGALGVELTLLIADTEADAYQALRSGAADLIAANLDQGQSGAIGSIRYSSSIFSLQPVLIMRKNGPLPADLVALGALDDAVLVVPDSTAINNRLLAARAEQPALRWEVSAAHPEQLLYGVWNGDFDFTVADQLSLMKTQNFYPELRVGPPIGEPREIAWATAGGDDASLADAIEIFLSAWRDNGRLADIKERHLGHLDQFDYVETRVYLRQITELLPEYRDTFIEAAETYALDWRLLAAMGYQESHWNPRAVSATGVRGIMMLTTVTAEHLGVTDRTDPTESIVGGARYLRELHDRLPDRIPEPDRTWLAMAAYNVGPGHLDDARRLTEQRGGNPDLWRDVKLSLPLLSDPNWYTQTRHGRARGQEPVDYVRRIRIYHELLTRITEPGRPQTLEAFAKRYQPEHHDANRLARVLHTLL